MPRHAVFRAALGTLVAAVFLLAAPAGRAAERAEIIAFLDITGFDVALDGIALTAADAPGMLGMAPEDFGQAWTRIADEVFDPAAMRAMAMDMLSQTLDDEMLLHAAGFYASDLGQRLVAAENAAQTADDDTARRERGRALLERASKDRVAVLRRLVGAVDPSGQAVRAVQEVMVRFTMAASRAGVLDYRIDEGSLRAMLAAREKSMRAEMARAALVDAALTYHAFSEDEIAAYAQALEDPTMRRVYELMNAVQFEITANRLEALAARMAELPPEQEL